MELRRYSAMLGDFGLAEEHVNHLADRLERLVRAPKGAKAIRSD
jgi:hypothetical protein